MYIVIDKIIYFVVNPVKNIVNTVGIGNNIIR